jgi:hypothetical protein
MDLHTVDNQNHFKAAGRSALSELWDGIAVKKTSVPSEKSAQPERKEKQTVNLTFNTQNVSASVALKALQHYRAHEFQQAINSLLDVLDSEPDNWQARLMLAVCYYKTTQLLAAERAFRAVYEKATTPEMREMGCEGLRATRAKLERKSIDCPPEFGEYSQRRLPPEPLFAWLDMLAGPQNLRAWTPSYSR